MSNSKKKKEKKNRIGKKENSLITQHCKSTLLWFFKKSILRQKNCDKTMANSAIFSFICEGNRNITGYLKTYIFPGCISWETVLENSFHMKSGTKLKTQGEKILY